MRRLGLITLVAVLAALFISIATLTAGAQTANSASQPSVSQGTVTGANPSERRAAKRDIVDEEALPDYSQVVDSTNSRRFEAPGWNGGGSDVWAHGGKYVSAGSSTSDARFKLKTPTGGDYALYAWWPGRS